MPRLERPRWATLRHASRTDKDVPSKSHLLALTVLLLSSSWPTATAWAIVLLDAHICRNMCLSAAATATGEGERCASLRVVRGNSDANCLTCSSCCTYECVLSPCLFVTRWPCFIFSFVQTTVLLCASALHVDELTSVAACRKASLRRCTRPKQWFTDSCRGHRLHQCIS